MARFDTLSAWLDWQQSLHFKDIDLGLERVQAVYERLNLNWGKTQRISVAGTNGKGSTIAFLNAIYSSAGYRVAQFTSPHFIDYNERIQIDGVGASDAQICDAFERIDQARCLPPQISLSYFEFSALAAFCLICDAQPDVALLEVGLGGRLDATNVVDAHCAIVTSISIDHRAWLGDTREQIGFEKAGIFRAGVPAICGDVDAPNSVKSHAQAIGAQWYGREDAFTVQLTGQTWCLKQDNKTTALPVPRMLAPIQVNNAACAVVAISVLNEMLPVTEQAIQYGVAHAQVAGRMQTVTAPNGVPVILDVAHNEASAQAVVDAMRVHHSKAKLYLVMGMLADKEVASTVSVLSVLNFTKVYTATLDSPRTLDGLSLAKWFDGYALATAYNDITTALNTALADANQSKQQTIVLVMGSFFSVKEAMQTLGVGVSASSTGI